MNCISSRGACFYGGLVDTYKIQSKQNFVYSDEYQSTEENNCLKRKEECLFSLAHTRKFKPLAKMGLFCASKGGYHTTATILCVIYLKVHKNKMTMKIVRLLIQYGRYDILR